MSSLNEQYRLYLQRRGYKVPLETSNVICRWWLSSFAQPGFAHFWRVWNPFIGFWLLKLYKRLGGDRHRIFAGIVTFTIAGFCHDLVGFLLDPPDGLELELTIAFVFWGVLVLAMSSRKALKIQQSWPAPIHVALNLIWLVLGLFVGEYFT